MSIPIHCGHCGYQGLSTGISITSARVTVKGGGGQCPQCGGIASYVSGTYDFVGEVIAAFSAPGITREKVSAFRDIVQGVANGSISNDRAKEKADALSPALSSVIANTLKQGLTISNLVSLIGIILALWSMYSSDADVEAALKEDQKQTELMQQMLEVLQEQPTGQPPRKTNQAEPSADQVKKSVPGSRVEPRKAAAVDQIR
jgi:hypothetical protein